MSDGLLSRFCKAFGADGTACESDFRPLCRNTTSEDTICAEIIADLMWCRFFLKYFKTVIIFMVFLLTEMFFA